MSKVDTKHELPRVPAPASAIIAPDRVTTPAVMEPPPAVMTPAKLRAADRKAAAAAATAAAAVVAAAAATGPAPEGSRWRENRLKVANSGGGTGDGPGNNSISDNRSFETDACSGSLLPFYFAPNEIMTGDGGGQGGVAFGAGGGGAGSIEEAHYAARTMASRRSSLEEALYGSCLKRPSFNSWVSEHRCLVRVSSFILTLR